MNWLVRGIRSSIGSKFVMAITGILLFGFVLAHMLGNLQIYVGRDMLNTYAEKLKSLGPGLWVMRLGLLGIFAVHILTAMSLTRRNKLARPVGYAQQEPIRSTYASRTMVMSGIVVLLFVVYHLAHTTLGWVRPEHFAFQETLADGTTRHDVYGMMIAGFQEWPIALTYVLAMIGLGQHLIHGLASLFQSLGWNSPRWKGLLRKGAIGLVVLIVLGNISMPISVLTGLVGRGEVAAEGN